MPNISERSVLEEAPVADQNALPEGESQEANEQMTVDQELSNTEVTDDRNFCAICQVLASCL